MNKKPTDMLTARAFAKEKGVSYTTVMAWLKEGLIPDAEQQDTPVGAIWQIPAASLEKVNERKRGPKKAEGEAKPPAKKSASKKVRK